jgi:UDP-galactopyranose mutase
LKNQKYKTDFLIVGAGPVGCVLAERLSNKLKLNCLIIDKRKHIAGNCFDLKNMGNMALKGIGKSCGNFFCTSFQLQVASINNNWNKVYNIN